MFQDLYDLVRYLSEKDLYGLYESSFNETKKKFPIIDKKEGELSQINEEMRGMIGDTVQYKDVESLKKKIFTRFHEKMKEEIPEDVLRQFLDNLFENLEQKIRSHPKIRDMLQFF
ncbi:MAG: hypothetical protein AYK18_12815 [Theionarchaea archaeon DG-70]|nr:MAG: hypothetical protein AYK18_12815 [Theionarchaea archaeon DG-70]